MISLDLLAMPLSPFCQIKCFELLQLLLIGHVLKAPGHLHSSLLPCLLKWGAKKMYAVIWGNLKRVAILQHVVFGSIATQENLAAGHYDFLLSFACSPLLPFC